jgi:glycosyltransferase involved in cell wall biosynthesis
MPPRVTYWTGTWDPRKEAISKEIDALRVGSRAHAPVVGFAPGQSNTWRRAERAILLSSFHWIALRAVAAATERQGDVTHVFGGQSSWHLLRALGRRPILLTAVVASERTSALPIDRIARVAVESETAIDEWRRLGIPADRIDVVLPGIDVDAYANVGPPSPTGRFRLLFASSPSDPSEIERRGIALLVELAKRKPDVDIHVPWRRWGNLDRARRALDALQPPANFIVTVGDETDMRPLYAAAHATIACFAAGAGKTCPNFVIEGLAAGRPALLTPQVGLSAVVAREGAGIVATRDGEALASALDRLRTGWIGYAAQAAALARREFSLERFRSRYDSLYERVASSGGDQALRR